MMTLCAHEGDRRPQLRADRMPQLVAARASRSVLSHRPRRRTAHRNHPMRGVVGRPSVRRGRNDHLLWRPCDGAKPVHHHHRPADHGLRAGGGGAVRLGDRAARPGNGYRSVRQRATHGRAGHDGLHSPVARARNAPTDPPDRRGCRPPRHPRPLRPSRLADLVIEDVTAPPVESGNPMSIGFTIRNVGQAPSGPFATRTMSEGGRQHGRRRPAPGGSVVVSGETSAMPTT